MQAFNFSDWCGLLFFTAPIWCILGIILGGMVHRIINKAEGRK